MFSGYAAGKEAEFYDLYYRGRRITFERNQAVCGAVA